mmetsp:Transcript_4634/g.12436  ORF Transcript_4634/g.12436 Transcript_4634/m.12436 type:complete len:218 (+) Transcript_4634:425-1078(+)
MSTHLMMPQIPAFSSVCPMLDFELVFTSGCSRVSPWCVIMQARTAPTSMGSPSAVPVPCSSWIWIFSGGMAASRSECLMHSCCEGPCGAVKLALRPSWFMQVPQIMASRARSSPSLSFMYIPASPSLRRKPSPDWSNVKHLPWMESIFAPQRPTMKKGSKCPFAPMAMPYLLCSPPAPIFIAPVWSGLMCECTRATAVREEEHAVSMVDVLPFIPKT